MNPYGVPEITPAEVANKRETDDPFLLVDVREQQELMMASLGNGFIHMPLSDLAQRYEDAIPESMKSDKDQEIVIFCHHGNRSAQVAAYLKANGWTNVLNMTGGIHRYALEVDSEIGFY